MTSVEIRRGDYVDGSNQNKFVQLKMVFFEQRDTREPFHKGIPLTQTRMIWDYGKFTRYIVLTGKIKGSTKSDAYTKQQKIETAVETWWNTLLYSTLPTLRIDFSDSDTKALKVAFMKGNYRLNPNIPLEWSYTLEVLQGQETQPT